MRPFLVKLPDRQKENLQLLAGQVELSMSDLLRRFLDHCFQRQTLNVVFPSMSGKITVENR